MAIDFEKDKYECCNKRLLLLGGGYTEIKKEEQDVEHVFFKCLECETIYEYFHNNKTHKDSVKKYKEVK